MTRPQNKSVPVLTYTRAAINSHSLTILFFVPYSSPVLLFHTDFRVVSEVLDELQTACRDLPECSVIKKSGLTWYSSILSAGWGKVVQCARSVYREQTCPCHNSARGTRPEATGSSLCFCGYTFHSLFGGLWFVSGVYSIGTRSEQGSRRFFFFSCIANICLYLKYYFFVIWKIMYLSGFLKYFKKNSTCENS